MNRTLAGQAPTKAIGVLVLGLGSVLLGDDGLGTAAVARVERDYRSPRECVWKMAGHLAFRC